MTSTAGRRTRGAPDGAAARVSVADEQSDEVVDVATLASLAVAVLEAQGVGPPCELALRLVDEDTIADLNRRHLDGEGSTDVLAFPLDLPIDLPLDLPSSGGGPAMPVLLGDVVVCPAVAARQAAGRGGRTDDELALLVVHGILHVLGMDHAQPDEAVVMQQRQEHLLAEHHRGADG